MSTQLDEAREHIEVANNLGTTDWATDHHLKLAVAKAHIAQVEAIERQTEQLRIANKLRVSLIEQIGELARATSNPQYAIDPAIGISGIAPDEWEAVGL